MATGKWKMSDGETKKTILGPEEKEKGLQELEKDLSQNDGDLIVYVENFCRFRMSLLGHSEDRLEYEEKIAEIINGFDIAYNQKTRENEIVFPKPFKRAKDYILALKKEDSYDFVKIIEVVKRVKLKISQK